MTGRFFGVCLAGSLAIHTAVFFYAGPYAPHAAPDGPPVVTVEYLGKPAVRQQAVVRRPPRPAPAAVPAAQPKLKADAPPKSAPPAPAKMAESSQLLLDPQKGKVFSQYFVRMKKKINEAVEDRYFPKQSGEQVSLIFIVNRSGRLEDVYALTKETRADAKTQAFAVQSVREAAPFDAFPADLNMEKICFNLTLILS